jgi:hypothetical protein
VVKGITVWVYGWIKHDWIRSNGSHVENRDLWEDLLCEVRKSGRRIYFNKIAATGYARCYLLWDFTLASLYSAFCSNCVQTRRWQRGCSCPGARRLLV